MEITLKVEAISDIFLESFTIRGHEADNCEYFVLNIDKFDVEASSNNSNMRDRLTIPNRNTTELYDPGSTSQAYSTSDTTITTNATIKNINVTDSLYLGNGDFIGNVTAISGADVTLDAINHAILSGASLFVGKHNIKIEKFDANANYIGTINPKNLNVIEFTLTNQDGESAETGDNKVFHESANAKNRVILEFSIISRHYDDFQVKNRENIASKPT